MTGMCFIVGGHWFDVFHLINELGLDLISFDNFFCHSKIIFENFVNVAKVLIYMASYKDCGWGYLFLLWSLWMLINLLSWNMFLIIRVNVVNNANINVKRCVVMKFSLSSNEFSD
jgi:hypothetical protein